MRRLILIAGLVLASASPGGQTRGSPPLPRGNEITQLVSRLTVGRPYTTRNMTVFPLHVADGTDPTSYATLDEALAQGWLKIYEKGQGRVQEVLVRNNSRHYVFLMAGEIISGAKQNRVITTDTLLRPHGPEVAVPVYCVEQGRWAGRTMAFNTEKSFANNALRYKAQSKAGQDAVWEEVNRVAKEAGVNSETSNFQDVFNDKTVKKALGEYAKCMAVPPRRCVGAAIVINNRIAGIEVFANDALFAALWPKVRRGYALDAYPIRHKAGRPIRFIDERDVRAFLDRVYRARFTTRKGVDLGHLYGIRGNRIAGEGLVFEAGVIHVNFAPDVAAPVRPGPIIERGNDLHSQGE